MKWNRTVKIMFGIQGILSVFLGIVMLAHRSLSLSETAGAFLLILLYLFLSCHFVHTIRKASRISAIGYFVLKSFLDLALIKEFMRPAIAADTWQVYDMSRYVFSDFGYMERIRQHIMNTHYEMAFPPLQPVLTAAANAVFNTGVTMACLINSLACIVILELLSETGRRKKCEITLLTAAGVMMITDLFIHQVAGGSSNVPGYLFLAMIFREFLFSDLTDPSAVLRTGLLAGLGLMNRFDFLAVVGCALIGILLICFQNTEKKKCLVLILIYIAAVAAVCFPWIIYSQSHFGRFFVTDNGRRLTNIPDTRPSTYFPREMPALTIHDDFPAWLIAFSGRNLTALNSLIWVILHQSFLPEVLVFFLGVFLVTRVSVLQTMGNRLKETLRDQRMTAVWLCVCGLELIYMLTGYKNERYHVLFVFFLQFGVMETARSLRNHLSTDKEKKTFSRILAVILTVGAIRSVHIYKPWKWVASFMHHQDYPSLICLNEEEKELADYLLNHSNCLCIDREDLDDSSHRFFTLCRASTILSPDNISKENVSYFVRDFEINCLYTTHPEMIDLFRESFDVRETGHKDFYLIIHPSNNTGNTDGKDRGNEK